MNTAERNLEAAPTDPEYADRGSLLPFVLAGAVSVAILYGGWTWYRVQRAEAARAEDLPATRLRIPLTDFELAERSGRPFRSADMRGKVWVASYFFSSCIGTCLTLNENIARMNHRPELADVTWVSITCDPDNDTVDVLSEYAKKWNASPDRWLFCRGDFEYTKSVARGMNLTLAMKMHADHAAVIDRTGTIRGLFDATSTYQCERMRELLSECLAEPVPAELSAGAPIDSGP